MEVRVLCRKVSLCLNSIWIRADLQNFCVKDIHFDHELYQRICKARLGCQQHFGLIRDSAYYFLRCCSIKLISVMAIFLTLSCTNSSMSASVSDDIVVIEFTSSLGTCRAPTDPIELVVSSYLA